MWKVYLDMKEYAAALANCRDPPQRDQVYLVQVMSNKPHSSKVMAGLFIGTNYSLFTQNFTVMSS